MLNGFGWPHLLILGALVVLFFGAKRLPDAARGLGRSMRIFRAETRGMAEDESAAAAGQGGGFTPQQQVQQTALPPQQPYTPPATEQARSSSPVQGEQQH